MKLFYLGICLAIFCCDSAFAQTPSPPAGASASPSIKIGSTIYADITQTLAPKVNDAAGQPYRPNTFNITRAYVNVTGSLNPVFSFRVTSDIAREISAGDSLDGSYLLRLKFAYAQFTLDKWTGRFTQTWIRFGLTPTPFVEGRDTVYRYRWQGMLMPEKEGLLSSSDAGVSLHTSFPSNYGDVQISVLNGEGYTKPEANNQKAIQGRVTLRPMASAKSVHLQALKLSAFYDHDHYMRDADKKRGIYGITYEAKRANFAAEIVQSRDELLPRAPIAKGSGWDVFVTPFFNEKGNGPEALLRFDHWRPDSAKPDVKERLILGLSYWWTPKMPGVSAAIMLDYEGLTVKNPSTPQPAQRKLTLHSVLTF